MSATGTCARRLLPPDRAAAAWALGRYGAAAGLEALRRALKDQSPRVRESAAQAVAALAAGRTAAGKPAAP